MLDRYARGDRSFRWVLCAQILGWKTHVARAASEEWKIEDILMAMEAVVEERREMGGLSVNAINVCSVSSMTKEAGHCLRNTEGTTGQKKRIAQGELERSGRSIDQWAYLRNTITYLQHPSFNVVAGDSSLNDGALCGSLAGISCLSQLRGWVRRRVVFVVRGRHTQLDLGQESLDEVDDCQPISIFPTATHQIPAIPDRGSIRHHQRTAADINQAGICLLEGSN